MSTGKRVFGFVRTTVIGGVVFLVPLVLASYVVGRALKFVGALARPVTTLVPVERVVGIAVADLVTIGCLIGICFLAGLFARSARARGLRGALEDKLLHNVPGYGFVKSAVASFHPDEEAPVSVVLCKFDDGSQVGFEIERLQDGRVTVFLPDAPVPWSGSVTVVDADRVEPLDAKFTDAIRSLRKFGTGTGKLLARSGNAPNA